MSSKVGGKLGAAAFAAAALFAVFASYADLKRVVPLPYALGVWLAAFALVITTAVWAWRAS